MRNGRAPAGFRRNGWPFGLQSRSRLGTFEPAKNLESGEVLALGNPCETAKPHSRIPAQGVAVWSAEPISFRHLRTRWKHGGIGAGQPMRNSTAPAGFRPNGWPFGLQSRSRLGTFEPAKSMESGEVLALGNPCETAEPLQDSGPMGGRLVCRADLVWAPLNPLKAWRVERYWRWATHAKQQSPTAGFQPKGWPFGLPRRSRLGTFEPAKSMEVYRRWATHAKRQSPCRIQAQWVAVWAAEPISFGHLWTR